MSCLWAFLKHLACIAMYLKKQEILTPHHSYKKLDLCRLRLAKYFTDCDYFYIKKTVAFFQFDHFL